MRNLLLSSLGLLAIGCASHPAPTEQVASSLAAVRGAEEAGALQVPEAALHVKLAEEQIEQAQALMSEDENQRAEDLAVRAYQDAELAIALARENAARQRLQQFAEANPNHSAGGEQPGATPQGATTAPATGQVQPSGTDTTPRSGQTVTD
jgi:pyridoxal biosynthesis lyase PdxS